MEFTIKLDRFEGPYTKLLGLIEEKKLSITEISLAQVADEYITYVKSIREKDLIDISQFIVVASTLILIKAKSLLPGVIYNEEEEKQVHDLEHKLLLYAMLTEAAQKLRSIYKKNPLYSRARVKYNGAPVFVPDSRLTPPMLLSIATLTLQSFVTSKQLVKVAVEQVLRLEHVIESMLERIRTVKTITLGSLAENAKTIEERKKLLIVNFIALLELMRSGAIHATQDIEGGEIQILPK